MGESDFTLERAGARLVAAPDLPRAQAERWLEGWREAFGASRRPVAAMPRKEDLALATSEVGEVIMKRRSSTGLRALARRFGWRRPRAQRGFETGRALLAAGVPTPSPLAWIFERASAFGVRTCLVTRFVSGVGPWEFAEDPAAILSPLAETVASLHRAGWRHGDLKAPNLLVEKRESHVPRVWLLDLDGARRGASPLARADVLRDLGRLGASFLSGPALEAGVTREHWGEFVSCYLEHKSAGPEREGLLEETLCIAERKVERNRRLGLPLA